MNVPSDASSAGDNPDVGVHERYVFTEDWLTPRLDLWKRLFEDFVGAPSLRFVEVGVYEGRATTWLLDHVLTAPDSTIDCVDPFRSGAGTAMPDPVAIRSRFLANLDRSVGSAEGQTARAAICRDIGWTRS